MKATIRYTIADYHEALKLRFDRSFKGYAVLALGAVILIAAVGAAYNGERGTLTIFNLFLGALLVSYRYTALRLVAAKEFASEKRLNSEVALEFGDSSVRSATEFERSETKWEAFSKARHNKNVLVLYKTDRHTTVVPRAAFSESDWDRLIDLANERVSDSK